MKRALLIASVICLLGAAGYGVERLLALRAATAPPSPEAFVQAAWSVYRLGPGHRVHVDAQGLDCTACHRAGSDQQFDEPGPGACLGCHEQESQIEHVRTHVDAAGHHADADSQNLSVTDCLLCHGFGPDPEQKPTDCLRCHASAKGELPAVETHAREACTACHEVHENRITPIACQQCHALSLTHGEHPRGSPAQCLDCHRAHAKAEIAATSCGKCHAPEANVPVPASATAGPHTCTGCHAPHAFAKREVKPCTACHEAVHPLAGAGHRECSACHAPHAVRESARAENLCTSCHRDVELKHAQPLGAHERCTGCHAPHPEKQAPQPATCTSCHTAVAASDTSAHAAGAACTSCHAPHDFRAALVGHASCTSCHKARFNELASHAGHARCEGCHTQLPHGGMTAEVACARCHAEQAGRAHPQHQNCTQCHDAHTGARPKQPCASCHRQQVETLSPKHGDCSSCHDAHTATPIPAVASCTACHSAEKLPGLHTIEAHQERCASCHQAHPEAPPAAPATCLGCHDDMEDHQPTATRCNGCHAFRAPPKARGKASPGLP